MQWKSRRVLVVCGVLAIGQAVFLSLPTSAKTETPCEALKRWAHAAYEGKTPTLDQLAQFDRPHRIAIFNVVTPAVRAGLVQEQLRRFSERTDLSPTQRDLIEEGRSLATPSLYAKDPASVQSYKSFWAKADKQFTRKDQRQPWFDLGSVAMPPVAPVLTATMSPDAAFGFCGCSQAWNDCAGTGSCLSASCSSWTGCGPSLAFTCDGKCQ